MALYLAPHGWDHPGWAGEFYPDDLPGAWRLTYFFNEFDTVVVPSDIWFGEPDPMSWREDSPPASRFFFELPRPSPEASRLVAAADTLGGRLAGLVATPGLSSADLAWWRGRVPVPMAGGGQMALGRWEGPAPDLRLLRERMSSLAAGGSALLLFEGRPPALAALRAARTLAPLLGLETRSS